MDVLSKKKVIIYSATVDLSNIGTGTEALLPLSSGGALGGRAKKKNRGKNQLGGGRVHLMRVCVPGHSRYRVRLINPFSGGGWR